MVTKNISDCQSVGLRVILEHPSIRRLLQEEILKAWIEAFSPSGKTPLDFRTIPIYRLKHKTKIIYRCSLALQLRSQLSLSSNAIAQQLVTHLTPCHSSPEQPIIEFTLEVGEGGIIDCCLCDRSLIIWLEKFPQLFWSFFRTEPEIAENLSLKVLPIQYTHARCCSLLRLGELDGLIEFDSEQLEQQWLWKKANPIKRGVLKEIKEYSLIGQILNLVDDIEQTSPKNAITLGNQLCEAFWEFERYCRIWGEVKQKTPELAQARLGLVAITQIVLRWLLQEKFKVTAYIEM